MKYKHFFYTIILILLTFSANAQVDNVVIDISEKPLPSEIKEMPLEETVEKFIEKAKYFDNRYQGDAVYVDFTEEVANQFPDLSRQDIRNYKDYIREGLKIYRYFKNIYQNYKEKILVPDAPTPVFDDSEYDINSEKKEYVEADEAIVIPDFKKVISYSSSKRDVAAYEAKMLHDTRETLEKGSISSVGYMLSSVELKKLPFYDIIYDSPITGKKGIGEWDKKNNAWARIISTQTGLRDQDKVEALIHFSYKKGSFIKASDSANSYKPQISFEGSENLKSFHYSMPTPMRLVNNDKKDWTIYAFDTAIPVTFVPEDNTKPLIIRAKIKASSCNIELVCSDDEFSPNLKIGAGKNLDSSVYTYITQMHLYATKTVNKKISVLSSYVEKLDNGSEVLKIEIESATKIKYFEAFLSGNTDVAFEQPRVMIDGKKAIISFISTPESQKIEGKSFELTIILSKKNTLRTSITPLLQEANSPQRTISLYLLGLAVLGGLILNLMPCVFPVLSIKLLSLTKFGARRKKEIRRNFLLTISGIFISFFILASFLSILKMMGQNIGWGIQFQSPIFLTIMIFSISVFILEVSGVISISTPSFINKMENKYNQENFMHFLTGVLIVFMATPCTAPYLATAIGFAFAGTSADIFLVLSALALGLSLPYILFYFFPFLIIIVPTPGPWMQKLNAFMMVALFLTLIWLFSVLLAQTALWLVIRLIIYCIIFSTLVALLNFNRTYDYPSIEPQLAEFARKKSSKKLKFMILLLISVAIFDTKYTHMNLQNPNKQISITHAEIEKYLKENKTVLVEIGAEWCLTCKYNTAMVFTNPSFRGLIKRKKIELISIDWTNYNNEILQFMEKYGRSALPFYIIFSPLVPDGMVLPEILTGVELENIINNISL